MGWKTTQRKAQQMILRNPTGRAARLEILAGPEDAAMVLTIGAHASVDLARYQRALETLAEPPYRGIGSVLLEGASDGQPAGQ